MSRWSGLGSLFNDRDILYLDLAATVHVGVLTV